MTSNSFLIEGLSEHKLLHGTIPVYGSKNAVLPILTAAALLEGDSHLTNVPEISDVVLMSRMLEDMGAYVTRSAGELTVNAKNLTGTVLSPALAKAMRASILFLGPLLARLGEVTFPHPGGDVIGERPIDIFISGFQKLGATFSESADSYTLRAPGGLKGGEIFMRTISVTATEAFMMAATLAKGSVTLKNCAMEPEVRALADFLRSCGAKIEGAGTTTILITPSVLSTSNQPFRIIPDRIEAATFLALGAVAAKELTVSQIEPLHLDAVLDMLSALGVSYKVSKDSITVSAPEKINPVKLRTHEYPGFPTDSQAPFAILLTQAEGESTIYETIFDGRLDYTRELVKMGADITLVNPHRARVLGKSSLRAAAIDTPDIRAGLSFMLAAAIAEGTSVIGNANLIDRGYAGIEKRLSAVGLKITRT